MEFVSDQLSPPKKKNPEYLTSVTYMSPDSESTQLVGKAIYPLSYVCVEYNDSAVDFTPTLRYRVSTRPPAQDPVLYSSLPPSSS